MDSASSRTAGWFAVILFCIAQIFSTIDRGMLALVIDPVRADLGISEIQVALLQGFAFAVFYVTAGLALGAVADRVDRRRLLIAGVIVWSLATVAGGFARDFAEMFASRLFLGVGEAVLGPCAVTMIADYFPANERGRPMSVYVFGTTIAFGVGSLVSGHLLALVPQGYFEGVAILRGLAPWRVAFVIVGAAGFVVVAMLLFLREPRRHPEAAARTALVPLRATLSQFGPRWRLYLPLYGALAAFGLGASVVAGWGAVLLTRQFGFQIADAGKSLGAGNVAWAMLGASIASVVVDRVAARAGAVGKIRLAALAALAAVPSCLAVFAQADMLAVILVSQLSFAAAIYGTTMLSVVTEVAPIAARAFAVALYAFVVTMIGGSLGPLAVAFMTESIFGSPAMVGWSIAIVGVGALCLSALLSLTAARALTIDVAAAHAAASRGA